MDKKILNFDTYWQASSYIFDLLSKRSKRLGVKHIFLVPKMHTLFFEQELSRGGGFFDIEVYSLSRLFYRLGGGQLLPKEGAVMILRDILKDKPLLCFERSKGFRGFCERLYQTICSFCLSGIAPDELVLSGALGLKLNDIKEVYKQFLLRTANCYVDKAGMLKLIKERLSKNNFFKNAHVYIVNFALLSPLERQLFDYIAGLSLSCTETVVGNAPRSRADTEIYSALSAADALKAAARRIRGAHEQGVEYSQMCLVCAPQTNEAAKRIFSEYKIPAYAETKIKLSAHALSQYLLTALRLKSLNAPDIIAFSKNPFCGLSKDQSDILENYINRFNIDYGNLANPFLLIDKRRDEARARAELGIAEQARKKLCADIFNFYGRLKNADGVKDFCKVVEELIAEKSALTDILQAEAAFNKLKEVLGLIAFTYKGKEDKLTDKEIMFLSQLLCEGIEASHLGMLPASDECVVIGQAENFRGKRYKYTFILDFNEGIMPAIKTDLGVIGSADLTLLKDSGIKLSPAPDEQSGQNEKELLQLISASQKLFLCYVSSSDLRPSPMLYGLSGKVNSTAKEKQDLALADDEQLALYASCFNGGLEQFLLGKNNPTVFTSSLGMVLGKSADCFLQRQSYSIINKDIFFNSKTVSASQLQTYFDCPYKHFIRFGLRAREDERGQISAIDIGSLIHRAAEMFFKAGFDQKKIDQIAQDALDEYAYKLDENPLLKQKLKDEIIKLCLIFASHVLAGQFTPFGAEIGLNKNSALKPVLIDGLTLTGSVDYADVFDGRVRIIDYKTGYAAFDAKALYFGVKLQLPLYTAAFAQNGYKPAAFFYFPFKARWDEEGYRFTGVFDKSTPIVLAQDPSLAHCGTGKTDSKILPAFTKQTKDGLKIGGRGAKTFEQLNDMCAYAQDISVLAVKQIKQGFITPSPYRENRYNSCLYCGYSAACCHEGGFRLLK